MEHKAVQSIVNLKADANGAIIVPDRIHLMSAGHWHTPWHGAFEMSPEDLREMVANFNNGVGQVAGSNKLPINYGHDISGKAAGWIVSLTVENNGTELWGDIEWTPKGRQMLTEGEFRYISPEWNPRDLPWENPEVEGEMFNNVITGAGLTNIPLFKKLQPIMASIEAGRSDNQSIKGGEDMDLEQVRVLKPEDLTDEQKAFLDEHKADLTDEERTTFGLVEAPETPEVPETAPETPEEAPEAPEVPETPETPEAPEAPEQGVQASASMTATITVAELEQLKASAKAGEQASRELLRNGLMADATKALERGAIKSDQRDGLVELLMASSESQREKLKTFVANLPDNKLLASEIGSDKDVAGSAKTRLENLVNEKIKASVVNGKPTLEYGKAASIVRSENKELAAEYDAEINGK